MHYKLRLNRTASGAGFFACLPSGNCDFGDLLEYLKACPLDDFMHKHLLNTVLQFDKKQFSALFLTARADGDRALLALLYEACLISDDFSFLRKEFKEMNPKQLSRFTPMLDIRSEQTDDPEMATLLADYRAMAIFVQFQDMRPAFGVPCYHA